MIRLIFVVIFFTFILYLRTARSRSPLADREAE